MSTVSARMRTLCLKLLRGQSFASAVAVLVGGTAASQLLVMLASPLLTRLYTPASFGALAVYLSALSILVPVASLRYDIAIPLPEGDSSAINLVALSLLLVLAVAFLTGLVLLFVGRAVAEELNAPSLARFVPLMPATLAASGILQVASCWAIRRRAFSRIAGSKLCQGLGTVLSQLVGGFLNTGVAGLLLGDTVGRTLGAASLSVPLWSGDRNMLRSVSIGGMRDAARRYRRFPLISGGSALLNNLGLQAPPFLLSVLYGTQVVGWFALAQRAIGIPMTLVGQAVAQTYLGAASSLARQNPTALRRLFTATAVRLALVGGVPIVMLAVVAPWLFCVTFGDSWLQAGTYVQLLSLTFAAQFIVVPLSQTLNILERQDLQLAWDVGRLAAAVGSLGAGAWLGLGASGAITLYGICALVAYVILFVMSLSQLVSLSNEPVL